MPSGRAWTKNEPAGARILPPFLHHIHQQGRQKDQVGRCGNYQRKGGQPAQGLDPAKSYKISELNPAPARPAMEQEGKTFTGAELMRDGILPSCSKALEASVIELRP